MRNIITTTFLTLDGVYQAPGGPDEDKSGGFQYGGWQFGKFQDELTGKILSGWFAAPFELLLGRITYDIFAAFWPTAKTDPEVAVPFNATKKYVVSHDLGFKAAWNNSVVVSGDVVTEIKKLKAMDGPDLWVWGSGNLIQTLLKANLIDRMHIWTHPVTIGSGKRLFADLPAPRPNIFYVYVILCDDDSMYIGQTEDIPKRWFEHNVGRAAEHTKRHKPLEIIHYEEFISREAAVKREQDLKTGFGRKWLKHEWQAGRTRQAGGTQPALWKLVDSKVSTTGVIITTYEFNGPLKPGAVPT